MCINIIYRMKYLIYNDVILFCKELETFTFVQVLSRHSIQCEEKRIMTFCTRDILYPTRSIRLCTRDTFNAKIRCFFSKIVLHCFFVLLLRLR